MKKAINLRIYMLLATLLVMFSFVLTIPTLAQNPQSDSAGLTGTVPADPPKVGATITIPVTGQVFDATPITVTGICPAELLVKIFKNQVFAGSTICDTRGTFTIDIDLFTGRNDITAIVYDSLGQPGPISNVSSITFNPKGDSIGAVKLILTSNFATRGADPGNTLYWPLAIAGGGGPYAVSVDWGDGTTDLQTLTLEGNFSIEHKYEQPGTYKVIVKAADNFNDTAFLQLVAVANGLLEGKLDDTGNSTVITRNVFILWPLYVMVVFLVSSFWLGRRYEVRRIRKRIEKNQQVF